jgi:hypothetical protein
MIPYLDFTNVQSHLAILFLPINDQLSQNMFIYKVNCPQINFPDLNIEQDSTFLKNIFKKLVI